MPRPRERSPPSYPQNWVVLEGPEETPQQHVKGHARLFVFFFGCCWVPPLKEESVYNDGLPQR